MYRTWRPSSSTWASGIVVTAATDGGRVPVQHETPAEVTLNGGMNDDQAGLARPPDSELIEPGDSGLYVVIYVHGVQDYLEAGHTVQPTDGMTELQMHSVIKELARRCFGALLPVKSCTRRTCQLVTNFDISASAVG